MAAMGSVNVSVASFDITLRDIFAMAAMPAYIRDSELCVKVGNSNPDEWRTEIATWVYLWADAMLLAREPA